MVPTTLEDQRRHLEALERREMRIRAQQERKETLKKEENEISDDNEQKRRDNEPGDTKGVPQRESQSRTVRIVMPSQCVLLGLVIFSFVDQRQSFGHSVWRIGHFVDARECVYYGPAPRSPTPQTRRNRRHSVK